MNDINIFSNEFCQNRYFYYTRLLKTGNVLYSKLSNCWIVSSYEDVKVVLADHQNFYLKPVFEEFDLLLGGTEHPEHSVNKTFIRNNFNALKGADFQSEFLNKAEKISENLVMRLKSKDSFDFMSDFVIPYSIATSLLIFEMKNISEKHDLLNPNNDIDEVVGNLNLINKSFGYIDSSHIHELIKEVGTDSSESIITKLYSQPEISEKYPLDELIKTLRTLVVVGGDSTMGLLSSSIHMLLTNESVMNTVLDDTETNLKLFINEILRYHTSVQMTVRVAINDVTISNANIKKGDVVAVMIGAANRDPSVFPDADEFNIFRDNNTTLSYGRGVHFCMGYHVSKIIAFIALKSLMEIIGNLQLKAEKETYHHSPMIMKFLSLEVIRK